MLFVLQDTIDAVCRLQSSLLTLLHLSVQLWLGMIASFPINDDIHVHLPICSKCSAALSCLGITGFYFSRHHGAVINVD